MKIINLLNIPKEIKRSQLSKETLAQLEPYPSSQIKASIFVLTFFLVDLLALLPMFAQPNYLLMYSNVPLICSINLWALSLLFRDRTKTKIETILFFMYTGLVASLSFFFLALKFAYMSGLSNKGYYIFMFVLYIGTILLFLYDHLKKYSDLKKKKMKNTPGWHKFVLYIAVPAGYIFAQYLIGLQNNVGLVVIMGLFLVMCVFCIFIFVKSLHKYFFIKWNPHLTNRPLKNLKKKVDY